jgi:hypothetical protein
MRICIFCGDQANSKEHVWPQWLMRQLGETEVGTIKAQCGQQVSRLRRGAEQTGKFVCTHCNNGWMSQLENHVKPIVEGLFGDRPVVLDHNDQTTLVAWACKNAMVWEAVCGDKTWFFEQSERWALHESLQLPPVSSVWIAKCVEHRGAYCKASNLTGMVVGSQDQVKAYVTTMGFGPLSIQILSSRLPDTVRKVTNVIEDCKPGPWAQMTFQIWPIQSEQIAWPASIGLWGELGLDAFSERWLLTHS